MKKRFVSAVVALCLLLAMLPMTAMASTQVSIVQAGYAATAAEGNQALEVSDCMDDTMWVKLSDSVVGGCYWIEVAYPNGDVFPLAGTDGSEDFNRLYWSHRNPEQGTAGHPIVDGIYTIRLYSFTGQTTGPEDRPEGMTLLDETKVVVGEVALAMEEARIPEKWETIAEETERNNVANNVAAIKSAVLTSSEEGAAWTLNLTAQVGKMTAYANGAGNQGKWFPLLLRFMDAQGNGAAQRVQGDNGYGVNPEDIADVAAFGGVKGQDVVLWLNAETADKSITFTDHATQATCTLTITLTADEDVSVVAPPAPTVAPEIAADEGKAAVAEEILQNTDALQAPEGLAVTEAFAATLQAGDEISLQYAIQDVTLAGDHQPASLTMDIKPVVLKADGSVEEIAKEQLSDSSVTFRIPLAASLAARYTHLNIQHVGGAPEWHENVAIQGKADGKPYVEIQVTGFSTFVMTGVPIYDTYAIDLGDAALTQGQRTFTSNATITPNHQDDANAFIENPFALVIFALQDANGNDYTIRFASNLSSAEAANKVLLNLDAPNGSTITGVTLAMVDGLPQTGAMTNNYGAASVSATPVE